MQMAKLKNGAEVMVPLINITMVALQGLMTSSPIAFYELMEVCKNKDHKLFGDTDCTLKNLSLMESDGIIHKSIENIVLSAINGKGLNLYLVNPVEEMIDEEA